MSDSLFPYLISPVNKGKLRADKDYVEKLIDTLSADLDFQNHSTGYSSHNFHSFPAKFPPQLPAKFILNLTEPEDIVLDPMAGSGTTIIEAFLAGRKAIGFDIDPLALMISRVKTNKLDAGELSHRLQSIVKNAQGRIGNERSSLEHTLENRWDSKTKQFVDYWFASEIQIELLAIVLEIERIDDEAMRNFFQVAFSAIIITKSGGVSFALDLAHTRPHRAKIVISRDGKLLLGRELVDTDWRFGTLENPRLHLLKKKLRSPLEEFQKRCTQNFQGLDGLNFGKIEPTIQHGDIQNLPLADETVDLIVTSPPYASNAIDYMRAHKFSLVWFGHQIDDLTAKRKEYIGGEILTDFELEELPRFTKQIIDGISGVDPRRGKVLYRYYSEMKRALEEMHRVLKPGKSAIVVVGNSIMRGRDTQTQRCLADIGKMIGFEVPKIGVRRIDRNKRMMPAAARVDRVSRIQQRMHQEYVIGFYKPPIE